MMWNWLGFLGGAKRSESTTVRALLERHFGADGLDRLSVSERQFPFRVRADLQREADRLFGADAGVAHFCGVRIEYAFAGMNFAGLLAQTATPAAAVPPEYEDVGVGDDEPVRCLKNGLWLAERKGCRYAVLLSPAGEFGRVTGMQFQVAAANDADGTRVAREVFRRLEEAVQQAGSYRGKVLSLEQTAHSYSGEGAGITVHRLDPVARDQVILPPATLDLLDRNVVRFVAQRPRLKALGQSVKKGLLFYGPPGTGKTLTIRYLAGALPGHTTLLVTAEQVALLPEYMTLARLLQPSVVVIEDADLIARDRGGMNSPCEEVMLNKLLNEMDGLAGDAEVLFVLTTNRPEALEPALAARPGRIDQAIEFPLPDADGRARLVRLYARGVELADDAAAVAVRRTAGVSAAFIKELMRRAVQASLDRGTDGRLTAEDVEQAVDELLFRGGSLNLKLLGGAGATVGFAAATTAG